MGIIINNLHYTAKQQATGSEIEFTVRDANRNVIDLTPWTITITLEKDKIVTLNAGSCSKLNQTTDKGKCIYTFSTEINTLELGEHQGNLKMINGSQQLFWPTNQDDSLTYFTVEIQRPIG